MHRSFRKLASVLALGLALGAVAAPFAQAHRGKGHGKKPIGTIASFDGTTLTVTLTDGSTATATATEDTQVKLEHRGHRKGHKKPSNGTLEDLAAGNFVLRMKVDECGELDKIRLRRSADAGDHHTPEPEPTATPTADPTTEPTPSPTETTPLARVADEGSDDSGDTEAPSASQPDACQSEADAP
jgi:hypothetical protein